MFLRRKKKKAYDTPYSYLHSHAREEEGESKRKTRSAKALTPARNRALLTSVLFLDAHRSFSSRSRHAARSSWSRGRERNVSDFLDRSAHSSRASAPDPAAPSRSCSFAPISLTSPSAACLTRLHLRGVVEHVVGHGRVRELALHGAGVALARVSPTLLRGRGGHALGDVR